MNEVSLSFTAVPSGEPSSHWRGWEQRLQTGSLNSKGAAKGAAKGRQRGKQGPRGARESQRGQTVVLAGGVRDRPRGAKRYMLYYNTIYYNRILPYVLL